MKKFVDHKRERGEFHKSSTLQGVNDVAAWAPFGVRPPHFHGLEMKSQFFGLEIHKIKYYITSQYILFIDCDEKWTSETRIEAKQASSIRQQGKIWRADDPA